MGKENRHLPSAVKRNHYLRFAYAFYFSIILLCVIVYVIYEEAR